MPVPPDPSSVPGPTDNEVPYPPPPWTLRGEMWMGMVRTEEPLPVPRDLRPLVDPRRLCVGVVRYREGTLRYDELALGPLVRRGPRAGILIQHIWVNDTASLWGGRGIWGLGKEAAEFEWSREAVSVGDAEGHLVAVTLRPGRPRLPLPLPMPAPGFGGTPDNRLYIPGRLRGTPQRATMEITSWSGRLPALRTAGARPCLALRPFTLRIPDAVRC
ncbi:hypothetical protein GCM10027168_06910 [Streptomyces capparidis]